MGCDGGTIPTRDELVKTKKRPEQKDKVADLEAKWKLCALTQERLRQPIIACELGRLYNKESVLELLLDRSKFESAGSFSHIRGLKDTKELNLTENPAFKRGVIEKGDGYIDTNVSPFICPVVGIEMNGKHRFSYIWGCGCVLSERAFKEVKGHTCHKCGKGFKEDEIIVLNGTPEEVEELTKKMEEKRLAAKLQKKAKKAEKHKLETEPHSSTGSSSKVQKTESNCQDSSASSSSKVQTNGSCDKKSKISNGKLGDKKGKSIQKDPNASSTYKSLFTSCEEAKSRPKAHWVTYNPCFN